MRMGRRKGRKNKNDKEVIESGSKKQSDEKGHPIKMQSEFLWPEGLPSFWMSSRIAPIPCRENLPR